ncbi:hypothetical protein ACTFR8_23090 [Bacillus cereus group sp. MYBK15-3]|uniref:hypothetical protein n=1 Tax=unclassified Bacillus cereus group TaxID=2750818 RepID=UPI003F78F543
MAKLQMGDILLIHLDNPYHEWRIRDVARRLKYPIRRIDVTNSTLSKVKQFQYASLHAGREIIWLRVEKNVKGFVEVMQRVSPAKRVYVIELKSRDLAKDLIRMKVKRLRVVPLTKVKTFDDKREVLRNLLKRWGAVFENQKTEKSLIRLMIQNEDSWDDVRITAEMFYTSGHVFSSKDVEDLYPDDELYRLDEWFDRICEGNVKRKTIQMTHYYTQNRGYTVAWLINKLREDIINRSYVYQAYRKGVLRVPTEKGRLQERLDAVGWADGLPLLDLNLKQQERYIRYAQGVSYRTFVEIEEVVFSGSEFVQDVDSLYELMLKIKEIFTRLEVNDLLD